MSDEAGPLALVIGGGSGIRRPRWPRPTGPKAPPTVTWDIAGSHDVACDVTEPDAIDDAVGVTRMRWGVPTFVTVTAGVGHAGLLTEAEPDAFDRVMRVNARGPWLCMRAWVGATQDQGRPALSSPSRASVRAWSTAAWGSTARPRPHSQCWCKWPLPSGASSGSGSTQWRPA